MVLWNFDLLWKTMVLWKSLLYYEQNYATIDKTMLPYRELWNFDLRLLKTKKISFIVEKTRNIQK